MLVSVFVTGPGGCRYMLMPEPRETLASPLVSCSSLLSVVVGMLFQTSLGSQQAPGLLHEISTSLSDFRPSLLGYRLPCSVPGSWFLYPSSCRQWGLSTTHKSFPRIIKVESRSPCFQSLPSFQDHPASSCFSSGDLYIRHLGGSRLAELPAC